jgi:hypothetical protein
MKVNDITVLCNKCDKRANYFMTTYQSGIPVNMMPMCNYHSAWTVAMGWYSMGTIFEKQYIEFLEKNSYSH